MVNLSNQLTYITSFSSVDFLVLYLYFSLVFLFLELLFVLMLDFLENLINFLSLPNVHFLSFNTTFSKINFILSSTFLITFLVLLLIPKISFFIPWSFKKITSYSYFMEAIASLSCWCYQLAFVLFCFLNCLYFFIVPYLFVCLTST